MIDNFLHIHLDIISFTWVCAQLWRSWTLHATVPQIQSHTWRILIISWWRILIILWWHILMISSRLYPESWWHILMTNPDYILSHICVLFLYHNAVYCPSSERYGIVLSYRPGRSPLTNIHHRKCRREVGPLLHLGSCYISWQPDIHSIYQLLRCKCSGPPSIYILTFD